MLVTFGQGLKQPHGQRVEVGGVEGLARALESAVGAVEGWWSPHIWRDDYRDSEAWEGADAIGIDLDLEGHAPLPVDVAVQLEQLAADSAISGSIFHRTPAGARVVFVLAARCTDPNLFGVLARGAAAGVADDLREHGLDRLGLTIDPKPHADLGRLYFNPNTIAKGAKRTARVIVMRPLPYPAEVLRELVPPPVAAPALPPRARPTPGPASDPVRRAAAYIAKMGPSIEGAHGDDHAFRVAATLVNDFALPDAEALRLFEEWNASCEPPWADRDVARFMRSAAKNGKHAAGAKLAETRSLPAAGGGQRTGRKEDAARVDAAGAGEGRAAPDRGDAIGEVIADDSARGAGAPEPTPPPDMEDEPPPYEIPLIRAADAVEKPVEWLIENFLARGELTDLSGDPGVGKGGITASWAAQVTREDPAATVIFFATEDPLGRVKARLRAEGADLERVLFLDITKPGSSPVLPGQIDLVERMVEKHRTALFILDPALEFMDAELDSHKQQDVARYMGPLLSVAQRTGAAVLTVRHLNKTGGSSALYRASGSIGFTGKVRIALLASKNAETGERALAVTKNNLGADKHTIGFEVVSRAGASVIVWGDILGTSADELVNQEPGKKRGPAPARQEAAMDILRDMLVGGPMKVDDCARCCKSEGISRGSMYRAAAALGVEKLTLEMRSAWRLPLSVNLDKG